jgi:hypothetical protein
MEKRNRFIKILFLIIVGFCSCKSKAAPVNLILDYSYDSGWAYSYSVKVYSDGKAYLRMRKTNQRTDSMYVKYKINVDSVQAIISKLKEANIARKYEDTFVQDAASFNFIIYLNNGRVSKYYVYGNKYPALLLKIKDYANLLSKRSGWDPLKDTTITFSSMANFNYAPKIIGTGKLILPPKNL